MDRRTMIGSGFCLLGGAWLGCGGRQPGGGGPAAPAPSKKPTSQLAKQTFPLKLEPQWSNHFAWLLFTLKWLLRRLGKETALAVWNDAFEKPDDGLLESILEQGWKAYELDGGTKPPKSADALVDEYFSTAVEGVSGPDARKLVELDRGISVPLERLGSLRVEKEVTTYECLHLWFDGFARVSESLSQRLHKQGEFIAYDIILAWWIPKSERKQKSVAEFMKESGALPGPQPNIESAGLHMKIVRATDTEVIFHVDECAWANYFRERHPTVGYLMSCSGDEANARSVNDRVRLQRTSTLMEGGERCDFRFYAEDA